MASSSAHDCVVTVNEVLDRHVCLDLDCTSARSSGITGVPKTD
jgi:hypothetical protein